jgi:uncharacterized protein with ParB-like and HNH nuclease domain
MNPQEEFLIAKGKKSPITKETESMRIKEIRDKFEDEKLTLENYQREYIYGEKKFLKASKVIETILFGNILPAVVYFRNDNEQFEIVDGQQRLVSIIKYISNEYPLNFDETDDAFMLKGYYFKDLKQELKSLVLNYALTLIKITTDDSKRVTDVFLDLNYQPVPVTQNEIAISIFYGSIAKEAKRLSKSGAGKFVDFPVIWQLFGHQKACEIPTT